MFLQLTAELPEGYQGSDLGYLLHKHPDLVYTRETPFGMLHLFYPEVGEQHASVALILDVDPVELVRGKRGVLALDSYVNDRPYVAGSFMSVSIAKHLRSALNGHCEDTELALQKLPLRIKVAAVRCKGGAHLLNTFFEPLGYRVGYEQSETHSAYCALTLQHKGVTVQNALRHLYVLLPVLDQHKHYYLDQAEIDKLLQKGEGWLAGHPAYEMITRRYLGHRRGLTRLALELLVPEMSEDSVLTNKNLEGTLETPLRLSEQRIQALVDCVNAWVPQRVVDMGCGEGKILNALLQETQVPEVIGVDISSHALEKAERTMKYLSDAQKSRMKLIQGSTLYRDERLKGADVMLLVEVIEHLEPFQLDRMARIVFGESLAKRIIISTPNREYNALFGMPESQRRHSDHRFEWTRQDFKTWCEAQAQNYPYRFTITGIGENSLEYGSPTQMSTFVRVDAI